MLQLFAAYLTLTNAFADFHSVDDLSFAPPPAFGSYNLRKQVKTPQPLINLEETCFSSKLQDDSFVTYQAGSFSENVSCSEAYEMMASMYSTDVCSFAYAINDEQDTLLDRCGKTFCSECAQVENTNEDLINAKEVYEASNIGFNMAPGFEYSHSEGKQMEVQGMAAPLPATDKVAVDDASLPALEVPMMPAPIPAFDIVEVEGIEAPQFQDTPIDGSLEAPMMNEQISMVPPGLESTERTPQRLNRYQSE
jgi:hypothetical protein